MGLGAPSVATNQKREQSSPFLPLAWSNNQDVNSKFLIFASAIAAASGVFAVGTPIAWNFLTTGSGHSYTFFTGIDSSGIDLRILFPTVRNVLNGIAITDDRGADNGIHVGTGVNFSDLTINASYQVPLNTMMVADGLGNWSNDDPILAANFVFTKFSGPGLNPGETGVDIINQYISPFTFTGIPVNYQGGANFIINRRFVAIPNSIVFSLKDPATGIVLLANPAAGERVSISAAASRNSSIRHDLWVEANRFMSGAGFNYWISGIFEVWFFAVPLSTTSVLIEYQTNFPGATGPYSIFRSLNPLFVPQILVGTGTSGVLIDNSVSPATVYYYKLVADVGGVPTDVSTWSIKTPS